MTILPPPQLRHAPSARFIACVVLATVALSAGCREAAPDDAFDNADLARLALLVRDTSTGLERRPAAVRTVVVLPLAAETDVPRQWCDEFRKGMTDRRTGQWMPPPPRAPLPLDPNDPHQVPPIEAVFTADLRPLDGSEVTTGRLRGPGTLWIQPVLSEKRRVLARIGGPMHGIYVEATIRRGQIAVTSECGGWEV